MNLRAISYFVFISATALFVSCSSDDDDTAPNAQQLIATTANNLSVSNETLTGHWVFNISSQVNNSGTNTTDTTELNYSESGERTEVISAVINQSESAFTVSFCNSEIDTVVLSLNSEANSFVIPVESNLFSSEAEAPIQATIIDMQEISYAFSSTVIDSGTAGDITFSYNENADVDVHGYKVSDNTDINIGNLTIDGVESPVQAGCFQYTKENITANATQASEIVAFNVSSEEVKIGELFLLTSTATGNLAEPGTDLEGFYSDFESSVEAKDLNIKIFQDDEFESIGSISFDLNRDADFLGYSATFSLTGTNSVIERVGALSVNLIE